ATMPARQLAGVEHRGAYIGLRDADLDAAPGEPRVDGVVVAIDPRIWLLRDADHGPAIQSGQPPGQRAHPQPLLDEPLRRDGPDRAMHPLIDPVAPAVELVLKIERVREPAPRHEVGAHEPVRALENPLRLRIG